MIRNMDIKYQYKKVFAITRQTIFVWYYSRKLLTIN
jgi:hypothetical protein